ncbi:hydroxysteroid 11-beta-dehydrogenase 1-like protein [Mercenaria mercenaria]|uniref:hydroxysteroid 11-beta-dehydrogenase 1-like protein n=1 Tax=Mercenaria mercenaria TaxID=6596 RepID=UPI00234F2304|nr:hydroxysteroid 11-beta-dehydrogenase 1-like protein [Mercenaria mercenaria]
MLKEVVVVLSGMLLGYWLIEDFNPAELKGKRVFITGASTGIGEQLAYQFSKIGASVVITARRENKLKEVTEQCRKTGSREQVYDYVVADMTELDSIETVVEAAVQMLGDLDIIVLNHVFYLPLTFWTGSKQNLSSIKQVMTVNFESYIHLASYALPHLDKSNGRITIVNSICGKFAASLTASYSEAKFALDGFFSALRQELMTHNSGISITQCVLGYISK